MKNPAMLAWRRRVAAALLLSGISWWSAAGDAPLSGEYVAQGQLAQGRAYAGAVRIAPLGQGYGLAWRLDGGDAYRGVGLKIENVLGAVYWSDRQRLQGQLQGLGVVLYRIEGGELQGLWLPAQADGAVVGRETLKGSPELTGRYQITLGENPDNMTNYDGHVQIERRGEGYYLEWFTPGLSAVGNGIRLGEFLVVGYAAGQAPGTVGYCVMPTGLLGVWTSGQDGTLGKEVLKRQAGGEAPSPDADARCPPEVMP